MYEISKQRFLSSCCPFALSRASLMADYGILSPRFSCWLPRVEHDKRPLDHGDKPPQNKEVVKDLPKKPELKPLASLLGSAVSVHDLRIFSEEKAKEDGLSPRGVLESCLKSSGSIDDPPKTGNSECPPEHVNSRPVSNWRRMFSVLKRKSLKKLPSFPPHSLPKPSSRKSRIARESDRVLSSLVDEGSYRFKQSWKSFTWSDLCAATENFGPENLIGRGGFSEVYKGILQDGQLVAVKKLTKGTVEEQTAGFLSELGIIAHLDHPNTAKLIGCGVEGGLYIVLELSTLGSLGSLLHGSEEKPHWAIRYKIILGIADGLLYLHENCLKRIIHRDIKAENVLLTEDFMPQICDFGLAKWLPEQQTHQNVSKFEGTFGYFAPEYFMHGIVDEKIDIFAFGVLLLEIVTGRRALEMQQSLVIWAKPLLNGNKLNELADPSLEESYDRVEMERVLLTASLCIELNPALRPRMSQVVPLLRAEGSSVENAIEQRKQRLQRTYSEETLDAEEYITTKHQHDIDRLRKIALDS